MDADYGGDGYDNEGASPGLPISGMTQSFLLLPGIQWGHNKCLLKKKMSEQVSEVQDCI